MRVVRYLRGTKLVCLSTRSTRAFTPFASYGKQKKQSENSQSLQRALACSLYDAVLQTVLDGCALHSTNEHIIL